MYVVVSNVPGYMPEDDDPATFEDIADAREYLREEVERHAEYLAEGGETFEESWAEDSCYVVTSRPHDLGRVFEIMQAEPEA